MQLILRLENSMKTAKRTSVSRPKALGVINIPGHSKDKNFNNAHNKNISITFQEIFIFASAFFLALISLERAYSRNLATSSSNNKYKRLHFQPQLKFAWSFGKIAFSPRN